MLSFPKWPISDESDLEFIRQADYQALQAAYAAKVRILYNSIELGQYL